MKLFIVLVVLAFIATVSAEGPPSDEYLPPNSEPSNEYVPPAADEGGDATSVGQDGYRYRTVKRLRYRHRRDVSELPSNDYLPPNSEPSNEYVPPAADEGGDSTPVGPDGYQYRTVKRFRYRHRRDVSELPSNDYLPPDSEPSNEYVPPAADEGGDSTPVGQDGYQYRTVKRFRYRHRRDVSELPSNDYLPPDSEPSNEYVPPAADEGGDSTPVGQDGYQYRTVKRFRYRHRRDVSELPSNEYLPPVEDTEGSGGGGGGATPVGPDGYEYKTARRLRYRLRRH